MPRHPGFIEQPSNPEVRQPQVRPSLPRHLEQQVRGLHVPMYDARRMNRRQTMQQLIDQNRNVRRRQRTMITEQRGNRSPADQLHREHDLVVVRRPSVRRDHLRMINPQRLLPHEPHQRRRIMLSQHLGRHVRRPPQIPRPPDGPHPPGADQIDQPVPPSKRLHPEEPTAPPAHKPCMGACTASSEAVLRRWPVPTIRPNAGPMPQRFVDCDLPTSRQAITRIGLCGSVRGRVTRIRQPGGPPAATLAPGALVV